MGPLDWAQKQQGPSWLFWGTVLRYLEHTYSVLVSHCPQGDHTRYPDITTSPTKIGNAPIATSRRPCGSQRKANASFARCASKKTGTPRKWRKSKKEAPVARNNVIDAERLGDQPVIVRGVKIKLHEEEVVARWRNDKTMKSQGKTMWGDLSFETDIQAMALRTASDVIKTSNP